MRDRYEAVVFDMDGVVTDTARVHFRAWKQLFDEFLAARGDERPFSAGEYRRHVDGRRRLDGVRELLGARGVELAEGSATDASTETMWGLARRKDALFVDAVHRNGVSVFPSTITLVRQLREQGIRTALVTASRNADLVLAAAGATELFDVRVDGVVADELALAGKPDPATFVEAARRLGVSPGVCAIVEDALAGMEAGRRGRFGLVIGVDRDGQRDALRRAGADLVVSDLGELPLDALVAYDPWVLAYRGFDPDAEGTREALLTVGNGYFATRGAVVHAGADSVHYPATYVAGLYNRLHSRIHGHSRVDESIVNVTNWLPVTMRADAGAWLASDRWALAAHRVALDLRTATLTRTATLIDPEGRRTRCTERRFVSMARPHIGALELRLVPENWSGRLEVRALLDGDVTNTNVTEYRSLEGRHLDVVDAGHDGAVAHLVAETTASHMHVAVATRTTLRRARQRGADGSEPDPAIERRGVVVSSAVRDDFALDVVEGEEVVVTKIAGIATSRDPAIAGPATAAIDAAASAPSFDALHDEHVERWSGLWERFAIDFDDGDDDLLAVRVHLLHLLQTLSPHTAEFDVGVPARGLHGEAYRGHVFWDELFVFPVLNLRFPSLTRSLLLYRWRRLPQARRRAAELGCAGALFPWQSGSDGREETPVELFNPRSARWMTDNSRRQYHVNLAVAYNMWQHWQVTADLGFLVRHGAELLVDTARFFASYATYDSAADRYDVRNVMGPDEFHDGYPDRPGSGIDNNAYVNVMAAWALARACEVRALLGEHLGAEVWRRLGVDAAEVEHWDHVSRRLRVPFLGNGLLAQFEGYERLDELDLERYRARYGNIGRLDLILEAEDDTTNRYQVSKQADVLMLFYLLTAEELTELLTRLGYAFDPATIPATVDHYLARTSHGSTLSRLAHAWVLARTDRARSWQQFQQSLAADLDDVQGGTTREGIHLAAMAGSVDLLQRCYTGLDARRDVLWFNPLLPDELRRLELSLRYRNHMIGVHVDHEALELRSAPGPAGPVVVGLREDCYELAPGDVLRLELPAPA